MKIMGVPVSVELFIIAIAQSGFFKILIDRLSMKWRSWWHQLTHPDRHAMGGALEPHTSGANTLEGIPHSVHSLIGRL